MRSAGRLANVARWVDRPRCRYQVDGAGERQLAVGHCLLARCRPEHRARPYQVGRICDRTAWRATQSVWIILMVNWINTVLAVVGLIVGWVLALSLRTQARLRIYEKRLEAYGGLWHALEELPAVKEEVAQCERPVLARTLTAWYYSERGGMLLTEPARRMWLVLRNDLAGKETDDYPCPHPDLRQQASWLRTQLKADLEVYYGRHVSGDSLTFDEVTCRYFGHTVFKPFNSNRRCTRVGMRFRYAVLRADDPIVRAARFWTRVERRSRKNEAKARRAAR